MLVIPSLLLAAAAGQIAAGAPQPLTGITVRRRR